MFGGWRVWAVVIVIGLVASAWGMFQHIQAENARLKSALDDARDMLATAKIELALNQSASSEAETTHRVEDHTRDAEEAALQEIANAQTAHDIYAALVAGVDGVWDDPA